MILVSDDDQFTLWQHTLTHKPANATNACLWIERDKDANKPFHMEWKVEVKIYFKEYQDRIHGWGKTRHEAFSRLRQRLNSFRTINVHA